MRRQLAARAVQSLIVVFIVTTIAFFTIRSAPGDPFSYESPLVTPAVREHWRHQFGYDRPLVEQYVRYVASVARGELGYSTTMHETVAAAIRERLPRTLMLTLFAIGMSFVFGIMVGVMQAVRRGGWFDRLSSSVLLVFYSLPDFWAALMALLIFAYWWPILPAGNIVDFATHDYMSGWAAFVDRVRHFILPAASLSLVSIAGIARHQRAAMLEVLPSEYVRTARAKGLPERQVVWRHALRTAITPVVTLGGLFVPALLGGAVFVEKVYSWPGMGLLTANAIAGRDYDLVTASVIVGSVLVVIGNFAADVVHLAIDPRARE